MPCSWRLQRRGPRAQGEQRELHPVAGIAVVLQESLRPLGYLIPQALNTNMLNLGSSAVTDAAGLSGAWAGQSPAVPNWLGQTEDGSRGAIRLA